MTEQPEDNKNIAPKENFSRRSFLGWLSAASTAFGAGLIFKTREAFAAHGANHQAQLPPANRGNWPSQFQPNSTAPAYYPRQKPQPGEKIHEFDIVLDITVQEILPGVKVHAFTYNGTLPGPEIRVSENEWVLVNFKNNTSEFHTIHWHGMMVANEMDGVPLGTQWGVPKGQTFRYLFRAQPAGTHFYHCHNMTPLHVQAGMFGALIVESKNDMIKHTFPYERDYTLVLTEMDTNFVESTMNEMMTEMDIMQGMSDSKKMMSEMNGRMMGWFYDKKSFQNALKSGYVPPYTKAANAVAKFPRPNYFLINGKAYPMTEDLMIKKGENIRVRMINSGMILHNMHLHGHDFWHVCTDGSPLANPVRLNTVPVFPGSTVDVIIQGTNPGHWHFHDHSDISTTNNGRFPGGMMTMLMYEDAEKEGVKFREVIQVNS